MFGVCELPVGVCHLESEVLHTLCNLYVFQHLLVGEVCLGRSCDTQFPISDFGEPRQNPIQHTVGIIVLVHEVTVECGYLLGFIVESARTHHIA